METKLRARQEALAWAIIVCFLTVLSLFSIQFLSERGKPNKKQNTELHAEPGNAVVVTY